jgi:hypothetical protein
MTKVRDPISLTFTFNDMCQGFRKWREQTTTSPSNKHLGIYKSLLNAMKYQLYTQNETINQLQYGSLINPPIAELALQIQHSLMTMAIQQCHTYQRWTIVHNFMLEKIHGIPLLNNLRVIHIYKADWSLIQRFYVAHKISNIASKEKTVTTEQAGGRPGRSSIELATNRVLQNETIRLQRLTAAVMYNDVKACYDRIIQNLSNLSLLREGLPIELAQIHAQTFSKIQYHIKHKLGIGSIPHGHNNPSPVYGVGQGSTDASAWWSFVSDALVRAFNSLASDATIHSPISSQTINNKILGFVDDTTTLKIINHILTNYIILILQRDAQIWEKLLYITGGKLEISKCNFALFLWEFDNMGRALIQQNNNQSLHITNSDTKPTLSVPQIWITTLRSFLHQINGQIFIPSLEIILTIRQYDTPIMSNNNLASFTKSQIQAINACQIYLRVTTVAEICWKVRLALDLR